MLEQAARLDSIAAAAIPGPHQKRGDGGSLVVVGNCGVRTTAYRNSTGILPEDPLIVIRPR